MDKPCYSVEEVAALMGLSGWTVRQLFLKEKGVILIDRPATGSKRRYRSLRIPRAVYERVARRYQVA